MRITSSISSISFFLIFLNQQALPQEYITNLGATQNGDEIVIKYDLRNSNRKGYVDPKNRLKGDMFNVELFYSMNNKNYQVTSSTGDVGSNIRSGLNKVIYWKFSNSISALVGNIDFQVKATPKIPKMAFSITYATLLIGNESGWVDIHNLNAFQLKLYRPFINHSGSLLFSAGLLMSSSRVEYDYGPIADIRRSAFLMGLGYQTNKRIFSFYLNVGIASDKSNYTDGFVSNDIYFCPGFGIDIKLLDFNRCTILLPILLTAANSESGALSSGLCVQF